MAEGGRDTRGLPRGGRVQDAPGREGSGHDGVCDLPRASKDLIVGGWFAGTMTVTEAYVVMATGLFQDFNAL